MFDRYRRYNEITFVMYCMTSIDRAISRGRREKNRRAQAEISLEELGERGVDPADPSPGTEEEALRRDEYARLRSAIAGLPEDQRDALVLTQL